MKAVQRLILLTCILILPFQVQAWKLCSDTAGVKRPGFDLSLLPQINKELKVCDVVKQENTQLRVQATTNQYRTQAAEARATEAEKKAKKEKRKRIINSVVRTTIEAAIIIIIIIL